LGALPVPPLTFIEERIGLRMVAFWLAALWLGLIAPASVPQTLETGGEVIVDALEVFDEADDSSYSSIELKRGDRVSIEAGGQPGWLAIRPPNGSFHWVDSGSIQDKKDGTGQVLVDKVTVRSGASGARLPGPPRSTLSKGAIVRLLDLPPLTVGEGAKARSWRAIATSDGEVRYVQAKGVKLDHSKTVDAQVQPSQFDWGGSKAQAAIQKFEDALERSRRIDHEVALAKQKLADSRTLSDRSYDAKGLLQASSRKVDGQKVHALIGPKGVPIAYLAIPPGIAANRLLSHRVGVRGEVHYNESLGNRLITVKDLDPLEKSR
jgi:hypothetical protein